MHVPPAEVATLLTNPPQVAVPQVGAPRVSISWGLNLRARAGRGAARTFPLELPLVTWGLGKG